MKKLFILFAVASLGFVACNNESAAEATKDSAATQIDSLAGAAKDSAQNVADTVTKAIDSTASAAKDSLKAATPAH